MNGNMALEKAKIRQSFAAAANSYDSVAELQRTVGLALLQGVEVAGAVLDLGCGTGFLASQLLHAGHVEQMLVLDIALPMLQISRQKLSNHAVAYVCADAERLPLVDKSVDYVISNLALQWCQNLDVVFADVCRVLKTGGQLAFTTFGSQTLHELKSAWAEVDDFQHVNEFYSLKQLEQFLRGAGFNHIQCQSRQYVSEYANPLMLMKELKQLGAHNVLVGRNRHVTSKAQLQKMLVAYETQQSSKAIVATFEVFTLTARV